MKLQFNPAHVKISDRDEEYGYHKVCSLGGDAEPRRHEWGYYWGGFLGRSLLLAV